MRLGVCEGGACSGWYIGGHLSDTPQHAACVRTRLPTPQTNAAMLPNVDIMPKFKSNGFIDECFDGVSNYHVFEYTAYCKISRNSYSYLFYNKQY